MQLMAIYKNVFYEQSLRTSQIGCKNGIYVRLDNGNLPKISYLVDFFSLKFFRASKGIEHKNHRKCTTIMTLFGERKLLDLHLGSIRLKSEMSYVLTSYNISGG